MAEELIVGQKSKVRNERTERWRGKEKERRGEREERRKRGREKERKGERERRRKRGRELSSRF